MFLWDEITSEVPSTDGTADVEGPVTVVNLVPGTNYYVGVKGLPGQAGNSYTLKITGGTETP